MSQHEMDRPTLGQIHHYYAHAALLNADFGSYLFKSNIQNSALKINDKKFY